MAGKRPKILVTNDDSISANGMRSSVEAVTHVGDVVLVAPISRQTGMGKAITINHPLRLER